MSKDEIKPHGLPLDVTRAPRSSKPGHEPGKIVLSTLILVAAVANLNLSVANVALPSIGKAFDASQVALNLVAVGFSLGLAASVIWFGAIGDRYGRRMMLIAGTALAIPASVLCALAPSVSILVLARILGGLAAGMSFPTTLALITALWSGHSRTKAIALWSGLGGAIGALGPMIAGLLLEFFSWGSVFIITLPLAFVALLMALKFVPGHVNETTEPIDNEGGILSMILVGSLILTINFAPVPDERTKVVAFAIIALASGVAFYIRQKKANNPLYDLQIAGRRIFWVAACAGVIVFGSLMGAMFIGQQFLQNVLGYSTLQAGVGILPAAVFMVLVAPWSARFVESYGSRHTLLIGYVFCLLGFLTMLLLWKDGIPYWKVGLGYAFVGIGVGLAGTPASNSLTGSVPVRRAGMASGTADLQRDLGGAIMQSIFGALLTAGYAAAFAAAIGALPTQQQQKVSGSIQAELQKSFSSALAVSEQYPQYASEIITAAKESFLQGSDWAYLAGIAAIIIGGAIVFFKFPKMEEEKRLLALYQDEDLGSVS
jgi:MFS transporter, DHA2 family, multidrug resistance protein